MLPGCYRVEVIHYLNPYLIWIEVPDLSDNQEEHVFEQIGIYGILPLEKTLDIETKNVKSQKCEEWAPAVNAIMKDLLNENAEVWFSPTHIERRSSIFDDNMHKYGELIIKTENGKSKKLSKSLMKLGFAYKNVCEFLMKVTSGKIKTKLNTIKTQEVIKELENFYMRKNIEKSKWEKSVKKQTSVFQMSKNFESSLTVSALEKHNNQMLNNVLQNKIKDYELCKDVEEESLGRAYHKSKLSPKPKSASKLEESHYLKRKLAMAKVKSMKSEDLNDIRKLLDANSRITENPAFHKESDRNNLMCSDTIAKKHNENFLGEQIKQHNTEKQANLELQYEKMLFQNNDETDNPLDDHKPVKEKMKEVLDLTNRISTEISKFEDEIKVVDNEETIQTRNTTFSAKGKESDKDIVRQIAFGPPGFNLRKLKIQIFRIQDYLNEESEIKHESEISEKQDSVFSEIDSDMAIDIKNINILNNYLKEFHNVNKTEKTVTSIETNVKNDEELNLTDTSFDKNKSSSRSSYLQRKLKAYKHSTKHDSSICSSDTSNQASSSDDMMLENIDEMLNSDPGTLTKKDNKISNVALIESKIMNNVNPFKNIEPNISVFVDKLVAPILMVHSKLNRCIRPVLEMRDVYFNDHIYGVLTNMSVERPMMLQTVSWYTILRGYSLFMISPTASGKTLGYLPAVCRLVSDFNSEHSSVGPICIIVCATARSVSHVAGMATLFLKGGRVLACYAGVDKLHITTTLLNGCDILICTPSSLVRLMQNTDFGVNLQRLSTFVLDDCERLGTVYTKEILFFLHKIKTMLKARANQELKIQYILASRVWCDFMEPLAKKVPDTVICIGAFQECVLYSKANTSVSFVKSENKLDYLFQFLNDIDMSKRIVIVCKSDDEVKLIENALKKTKRIVLACDNNMTVHDLYQLSVTWSEYKDTLFGPILVCCDGNLIHMNITDAHNLMHFSLPPLFSMFCKRFSVLNDNYPSIFKSDNETVKVKILLEEGNVEQLPKILNFIRRCTENVPDFLDRICTDILKARDAIKAENFIPVCDNLLALGYCPDVYNCNERHTVLKDYDDVKDWLPKEGLITFKILCYHTAALYSARLLSNVINGTITNYPQSYSNLALKMGMYYSKESNKKPHGLPKIGDVCATSLRLNLFARCQVIKIISRYQKGNPNNVLVKLIDEERYEVTRDIYLYYLPENLKEIETHVVQIRLANIKPRDNDITFSDLARDHLKKITDSDSELLVRGNVSLTLGSCIFVNTLEVFQELTSLNETVVRNNLKQELLANHAIPNPEHLTKLEELCNESGFSVKVETELQKSGRTVKNLSKGMWANLESDTFINVFFASAVAPDKFFVRLGEFESSMRSLLRDIKKYVDEYPPTEIIIQEGQMVLAKFPDDSTYERARIDSITEDRIKCFYVDQGDWREVLVDDLLPITDNFINQLPFQAIECRLIGIKPPGNEWTEFSTNWFYDQCFEDNNGQLKQLFVQYFTKDPAEFTGGYKYGVILIDTSANEDVIVNQLMIDLNLAQENDIEIKYLDNINLTVKSEGSSQTLENGGDDFEKVSITCSIKENFNNIETSLVQPLNKMFQAPLRSVSLVESDDESYDLDKWDVYLDDNMLDSFPGLQSLQNLNRMENDRKQNVDSKICESFPVCSKAIQNSVENKEQKSDDVTTPVNMYVSDISPEKSALVEVDRKRRPKLIWRQNKSNVIVKIQLMAVDEYKLHVEERLLNFSANVKDIHYAFELELYGVINKEKSTYENKGQYILVKLTKVLSKNWLTLTRDGGIKKWIVYDVDNLDTSSDDDAIDDTTVKNVIKSIHNTADSDSDEDEIFDDVSYTYK